MLYIVSIGSAMTAFLASEGSLRQRKRAQTANHLSATAFRLFETHGYDVVAMEPIAAEADVAKATLYNYFPVKEALIAHRFRDDIAAGMAERAAALAACKTFQASLRSEERRVGKECVTKWQYRWAPVH